MVRLSCAVLAVLAACGPTRETPPGDANDGTGDAASPDASPLPHTLSSLVITPTNPIVQLDLNATGAQAFTVMGSYEDGSTDDVTSQVTWSVGNAAVGAMAGATLEIPAFTTVSAEVSPITANIGSVMTEAQITVVAYRQSGTQQDFFFILPYEDVAGPQNKPLDFSTAIPALDVFFLMDTTGSMQGEIENLQAGLTTPTTGVIDSILATVPDTEFGVGALEDFPLTINGDQYGETTATCIGTLTGSNAGHNGDGTDDQPFKLRQPITSNAADVQSSINGMTHSLPPPSQIKTIGCGGDIPEAGFEAVYQVATGAGLTGPAPTSVPATPVGFRPGAMPVVVDLSDSISHGTDEPAPDPTTCTLPANNNLNYDPSLTVAHSREQTSAALGSICGRFVGIAALSTNCDGEEYMTYLATQTNARVPPGAWDVGTRPTGCSSTQCCVGENGAGMATDADGLCPLVFRVSTLGDGVSDSMSTGIEMLARFAQFDVPTQEAGVMTDIDGNALPPPHTTADFLKSVIPSSFVLPPPPPVIPDPTIDGDQFDGVTPGTTVTFTINAFNDFVPQTSVAQIFEATISVLASGCNVLDQRTVLILVPPQPVVLQ
jgi:hypothetical protein